MEETPPMFDTSIEDLPNEVLEMLVPDLTPNTISTLKLVNRRFHHLLSNDRYYKVYLHYPEKYLLCSMKNDEHSGKEVIEEIKSGAIGKWEGYLTLENLHLKNWKNGRITHCEKVPLPPLLLGEDQYDYDVMNRSKFWRDMIDADGEHWIVSLSLDGFIILINITNEPRITIEKEIVAECVSLLPGQVICASWEMSKIVCLNIVNVGGKISLKKNFDFLIDQRANIWHIVTTNKRNIFVSLFDLFDGVLHFRDLKTGQVLEDVCLWDYERLKLCRNVPIENLYVELYSESNVEGPYIVMTISHSDSENVVVVFNVEKMEATTFVNMPGAFVNDCFITGRVVYILSSMTGAPFQVDFVHGVTLEEHGTLDRFKTPKLLYSFKSGVSYRSTSLLCGKLVLISDVMSNNAVHMVSLTDSELEEVHVLIDGIDCHNSSFDIIAPGVLVVKSRYEMEFVKMLKVTTGERGVFAEEFIDWDKKFCDNSIAFSTPSPVLDSNDLSKLVFYDSDIRGDDYLAIFYF